MEYCPTCRNEWDNELTSCPVCGNDMETDEKQRLNWIVIGTIDDKLSADFAREALKSYEIPAVIISRSGFFGNIGLTLNPFHNTKAVAAFEVMVPEDYADEAAQVLEMVAGARWHRKED